MLTFDCQAHEEHLVQHQLDAALDRVRAFPAIRGAIIDVLQSSPVTIRCGGSGCDRVRGYAYAHTGPVVLCDLGGGPALLAHELTHLIGGTELDAEIVENALFQPSEGAVKPGAADRKKFEREGARFFNFSDGRIVLNETCHVVGNYRTILG